MKSTILWSRYQGNIKAVQISRAVCCDKGTQPLYFKQKSEITLLIKTSDLNIAWLFGFKLSENFNNALRFNHAQLEKCVLKLLSLKWPPTLEHENRKLTEMRDFPWSIP